MKKIKQILTKLNNWKFIILVVLIVGGAFYWFEWRPFQANKFCSKASSDVISEYPTLTMEQHRFWYDLCLTNKGINK